MPPGGPLSGSAIPWQTATCGDTRRADGITCVLCARHATGALPVVVVGWDEPLDRSWRRGVLTAVGQDARWCLCCNGRALRIVDARHTWSRRFVEFDLSLLAEEPIAQQALWTLLRAESSESSSPARSRPNRFAPFVSSGVNVQ